MTVEEDTYVRGLADEIVAKVLEGLLAARDDRPLLTVQQAADRLGMGTRTLYDEMGRGALAWVQIGEPGARGSRKIEQAEIDRFIAERRQSVDPGEEVRG